MTYFGPMPESSLNMRNVNDYVQRHVDTFYRSITFEGGDVTIGGGGSFSLGGDVPAGASGQFFLHNSSHHLNMLETDDTDYPDVIWFMDVNAHVARFAWIDTDLTTYQKILALGPNHATRAHDIDLLDSANAAALRWDDSLAQWQFNDGDAAAPAISFLASGQQDVGIYRSGTDQISQTVGGTQVTQTTSQGIRGLAATGETLNEDINGFTNTSYADLDALTTVPASQAVAVTLTTGTTAIVIVSAATCGTNNAAATVAFSYRVSGASTIAAADAFAVRNTGTVLGSGCFVHFQTGLTAGSNTFEMQARVTANAGRIITPSLTVIAVNV